MFAGSATRCSDVEAAVIGYAHSCGEKAYDMTRLQIVYDIGKWLRSAKSIGDNDRAKAQKKAEQEAKYAENSKKWSGKSRKGTTEQKPHLIAQATDSKPTATVDPDPGF